MLIILIIIVGLLSCLLLWQCSDVMNTRKLTEVVILLVAVIALAVLLGYLTPDVSFMDSPPVINVTG